MSERDVQASRMADRVESLAPMLRWSGFLLAAGLLASACATTRAAAPVERPALEVPPVPPRVVEAAPAPDLGNPDPIPDLPPERPATPTAKPRPPATRDTANRDPQKPEAKPAEPVAPPPVEAAPATPPPAPLPQIRTPATADPVAAERDIRTVMNKAQSGLNNVKFAGLSRQRKKDYNDAKDFLERAEAAIKSSNFEIAKELAGKAEKLVNELQGR